MANFEASAAAEEPADDQCRRLCAALLALRAQAQDNAGLRGRITELESSRSWRITAPLRRLRAWMEPPMTALPSLSPGADGSPEALPDASDLLRAQVGLRRSTVGAAQPAQRQLWVDVSELALSDPGAGVQRVVHRLLAELLLEPPAGFRVEPVRLALDGTYVYARTFLTGMLGLPPSEVGADWAIDVVPGDSFLGLDLIRDRADVAGPAIRRLREQGVWIGFVVYDLLPLTHPEWFPEGMGARFRDWLQLLADTADSALCISGTVARQLRTELQQARPGQRGHEVDIVSFPLGGDHGVSVLAKPAPAANAAARFLVVGTVEPRKGHVQTLDAFERLWARGSNVELMIAGHVGWSMDAFIRRLHAHPQLGQRLHWIDGGDDARLAAAYRHSTALLAPSFGEGFGLPLVEAATHGLPILARDLEVFREVAGAGADYFQADDAQTLADAIEQWLSQWRSGKQADPGAVGWLTWRQSADRLRELLRNPGHA